VDADEGVRVIAGGFAGANFFSLLVGHSGFDAFENLFFRQAGVLSPEISALAMTGWPFRWRRSTTCTVESDRPISQHDGIQTDGKLVGVGDLRI
jgi:hypothetical protein